MAVMGYLFSIRRNKSKTEEGWVVGINVVDDLSSQMGEYNSICRWMCSAVIKGRNKDETK